MRAGQKGRGKNPTRSERERGVAARRGKKSTWKKEEGRKRKKKGGKKKGRRGAGIMRETTRPVPASFTVLYQLRVNDIQRLIPRPDASSRMPRHGMRVFLSSYLYLWVCHYRYIYLLFLLFFFFYRRCNKSRIEFFLFLFTNIEELDIVRTVRATRIFHFFFSLEKCIIRHILVCTSCTRVQARTRLHYNQIDNLIFRIPRNASLIRRIARLHRPHLKHKTQRDYEIAHAVNSCIRAVPHLTKNRINWMELSPHGSQYERLEDLTDSSNYCAILKFLNNPLMFIISRSKPAFKRCL